MPPSPPLPPAAARDGVGRDGVLIHGERAAGDVEGAAEGLAAVAGVAAGPAGGEPADVRAAPARGLVLVVMAAAAEGEAAALGRLPLPLLRRCRHRGADARSAQSAGEPARATGPAGPAGAAMGRVAAGGIIERA